MAKSPTEQVRELALEVRTLLERDTARQRELADLKTIVLSDQEERVRLQLENAALKQQLQDHIRRVELWDGRRWGLIVVLVGAAFSLASGLIVTLAKK